MLASSFLKIKTKRNARSLSHIIEWILGDDLQIGINVHVSDDTVILSSIYREIQGLLEAVNRHDAAVETKVLLEALSRPA